MFYTNEETNLASQYISYTPAYTTENIQDNQVNEISILNVSSAQSIYVRPVIVS